MQRFGKRMQNAYATLEKFIYKTLKKIRSQKRSEDTLSNMWQLHLDLYKRKSPHRFRKKTYTNFSLIGTLPENTYKRTLVENAIAGTLKNTLSIERLFSTIVQNASLERLLRNA